MKLTRIGHPGTLRLSAERTGVRWTLPTGPTGVCNTVEHLTRVLRIWGWQAPDGSGSPATYHALSEIAVAEVWKRVQKDCPSAAHAGGYRKKGNKAS